MFAAVFVMISMAAGQLVSAAPYPHEDERVRAAA